MKFNLIKLRSILVLVSIALVQLSYAQVSSISGKVTDSNTGEPLIGVTIQVEGTTLGTITDIDGNYSINVDSEGATLIFSFIGYEPQKVIVGSNPNINVSMSASTEDIGEVVVIGYGQVKKEDATGSVVAINADDFNQGAITSPQELVTGKIAGVQITSGGGAPGSGSTIRIRGGSSLSASNDPLFVIDGVPIDSDGISGMRNPLNTIHPNDIETMTVLKDASATAIYGSRASNGVIIITTKKGKAGSKMKISYNGNVSVGTRTGAIDVLDAEEFKSIVTAREGDKATALFGEANTNWQDEIFQTAKGTDHNVSLSGALENLPYRASIGYSDQKGLLKTSSMERFTGALSLNPTLFDNHLKINLNLKGMMINNRFADHGAIGAAVNFDPTQAVYDEASPYAGYFAWTQADGNPNRVATTNPLALLELREDLSTVNRLIGNIQLDYKFHFLPELRANINVGYDHSNSEGTVDVPVNAAWMYSSDGKSGEDREYSQSKKNDLFDFYLNYNKEISSISSRFNVMAGYSWQHFYKSDYRVAYSAGFDNGGFRQLITPKSTDPTEYYLVSFFGRLNYTLADRYLLTFTLRNDGTSRFSPENRWGLFPSAALAWQMNKEEFLKDIDAISDMKLRLGYGITGQQNIGAGDYPYLARYTSSFDNARYQIGDGFVTTLRPEGYDANLKWEETTTYNVGLDFGFFDNRLTGSVDYYSRETKDLLNVVPVPAGTNFTNQILTNVGNLTNQGIELSITGKIISKKDMLWEAGFNITHNKNEITKLTAATDSTYLGVPTGGIEGGVGSNIQIHSVGYPSSSFFVHEQVYDEDLNPIEGLYVDQNEDGKITDDDKIRYKSPAPDLFIGFSSNFNYKNFDVGFAARANIGNYVYNNINSRLGIIKTLYHPSGYLLNVTSDALNTQFVKDQYFSDYYLENASFLRLDHVTAGYTFENLWEDKINMRVYATVQNVFVHTKYTGLDPEVSNGIDGNVFPRPRTFMLGVSLDF